MSCKYTNGRHLWSVYCVTSTVPKPFDVLTHLVLSNSEGVTIHSLIFYAREMRLREIYVTWASHMARKWDLNSGSLASVHGPNHCATQPLYVTYRYPDSSERLIC